MRPRGIDMPARARAAEVLREYLEDRISGGQLQEAWPKSQWDPAPERIAGVILPHLLKGRLSDDFGDPDRQDIQQILTRCRLFLLSELPYAWGDVGAHGCLTLGIIGAVFLLGLMAVWMLYRDRIGQVLLCMVLMGLLLSALPRIRDRRSMLRSLVSGDLRYWPFDSREDLFGAERQLGAAAGTAEADPHAGEQDAP